jgi:hypothetical protein
MREYAIVALAYAVDAERRLVIISGEYASAPEWLKLVGNVLRDPEVKAGFSFLRDLRGAVGVPNAAMVVSVLQVVRRFWPTLTPIKGAIVTDMRTDSAALITEALSGSHDLPIQVFTSYEAALEWLAR